MSAKDKRRCAQRVFSGERADVGGHMCEKPATVREAGKTWCRLHAPSAVTARREVTEARWAVASRQRDAQYAVEIAEQAVLRYVRRAELAESCPKLERLRDALLAADEKARTT